MAVAAGSVLSVQYRPSGVSSFSPDSEEISEARAKWDEFISGIGLAHASERACLAEVDSRDPTAATATPVFASAAFFFRSTLGSEISHQLEVISRDADERYRRSV